MKQELEEIKWKIAAPALQAMQNPLQTSSLTNPHGWNQFPNINLSQQQFLQQPQQPSSQQFQLPQQSQFQQPQQSQFQQPQQSASQVKASCPSCKTEVVISNMNAHLDTCLKKNESKPKSFFSFFDPKSPTTQKAQPVQQKTPPAQQKTPPTQKTSQPKTPPAQQSNQTSLRAPNGQIYTIQNLPPFQPNSGWSQPSQNAQIPFYGPTYPFMPAAQGTPNFSPYPQSQYTPQNQYVPQNPNVQSGNQSSPYPK